MAAKEGELTFTLNTAMEPVIIEPPARLVAKVTHGRGRLSITHYTVSLAEGAPRLTLRYRGRLGQRLANTQGPAPAETPFAVGHIGPDGVYLSAVSHWLPRIDDGLISFSLEIDLPAGWLAVSQGKRGVPESRAAQSRRSGSPRGE